MIQLAHKFKACTGLQKVVISLSRKIFPLCCMDEFRRFFLEFSDFSVAVKISVGSRNYLLLSGKILKLNNAY